MFFYLDLERDHERLLLLCSRRLLCLESGLRDPSIKKKTVEIYMNKRTKIKFCTFGISSLSRNLGFPSNFQNLSMYSEDVKTSKISLFRIEMGKTKGNHNKLKSQLLLMIQLVISFVNIPRDALFCVLGH